MNNTTFLAGIGDIDNGLVPVIKRLNELGLYTRFCCSGLNEDHVNESTNQDKHGYIMFKPEITQKYRRIIKKACKIANLVFIPQVTNIERGVGFSFEVYKKDKNREVIVSQDGTTSILTKVLMKPNGIRLVIKTRGMPDEIIKSQWSIFINTIEKLISR